MKEKRSMILKGIVEFCLRTIVNMCLLFLLFQGYTTSYHFSYMLFADYPLAITSKTMYNIKIDEGTTPKDIALILETNGIVDSKELFLARVYLGKYGDKIKAGTYAIGPSMSPDEICRVICGMQSGGKT